MPWPYSVGPARREPARIDGWLPPGARKLEHHAIEIGLGPGEALSAACDVRLRDVPIVRALFAARGIPHGPEMTLRQFFYTPPFLIVEEEPGRELVFGVLGPFWTFRRGRLPPRVARTPDEFRVSMEDGCMAAVGNFRAEPTGAGSRVWTETWVSTSSVAQKIGFTSYWLAVGPFSAWIRRLMLGAARRNALAREEPGIPPQHEA